MFVLNYTNSSLQFVTSSHVNVSFLQVCFLEQSTRSLYKPFKEPLRENLPLSLLPQVSVKHQLTILIYY